MPSGEASETVLAMSPSSLLCLPHNDLSFLPPTSSPASSSGSEPSSYTLLSGAHDLLSGSPLPRPPLNGWDRCPPNSAAIESVLSALCHILKAQLEPGRKPCTLSLPGVHGAVSMGQQLSDLCVDCTIYGKWKDNDLRWQILKMLELALLSIIKGVTIRFTIQPRHRKEWKRTLLIITFEKTD